MNFFDFQLIFDILKLQIKIVIIKLLKKFIRNNQSVEIAENLLYFKHFNVLVHHQEINTNRIFLCMLF